MKSIIVACVFIVLTIAVLLGKNHGEASVATGKGSSCAEPLDWTDAATRVDSSVAIKGQLMRTQATGEYGEGVVWIEIGESSGNIKKVDVVLSGEARKEFPSIEHDMRLDGIPVCASGVLTAIGGNLRMEIAAPSKFQILPVEVNDALRAQLLQVAQDLDYNDRWLISLANAQQRRSSQLPSGLLRTGALMRLMGWNYAFVVQNAYGEEKHIFGLASKLDKVGKALGTPDSLRVIDEFEKSDSYTLHDVVFLNAFLRWYISPRFAEHISPAERKALGWDLDWKILPGNFKVDGVARLEMRAFTDSEEKPITKFVDFLGLID
jgi:hypothetical protein